MLFSYKSLFHVYYISLLFNKIEIWTKNNVIDIIWAIWFWHLINAMDKILCKSKDS